MVPGPKLLHWFAGWFAVTAIALWTPYAVAVALFALTASLVVVAWLWFARGWRSTPVVTRELPESFALGQWSEVGLILDSQSKRSQVIEVWEDLPDHAEAQGMPLRVVLGPGESKRVAFQVRFARRGDVRFGAVHLRFTSPGKWLQFQHRSGASSQSKVYPDYAPVVRYALLALQGRQAATGIRKRRMRGPGADFHQLREYREGDAVTTVDWKATARRTQLIVRDYQEERNQRITFLVDCGQRMRAIDGEVPLLDHSLNALLLVAYVALQQGDRVSIGSYGGVRRWMPPVQGQAGMPTVLRAVYDYQPTRSVSDMEGAARELLKREPRRSMVVILSHLRPEDRDDVVRAHQILSKRHVVLIASLRETKVEELLREPVETEADAWRYGAACRYVQQRAELIQELRARGMLALDLLPKDLPVALASEYLDVKASRRL